MDNKELNSPHVNAIIELALAEDSAYGDITSHALIPPKQQAKAFIIAKEGGILAGVDIAALIFNKAEPSIKTIIHKKDGIKLKTGDNIISVNGSSAAILKAERVALNFLSRLSGIASKTARYVTEVKGTNAVILDTRKTTPGMRLLEKYAVKMGGGQNHRLHLGDGILIKDNHIEAMRQQAMSLTDIIVKAKQNAPAGTKIEIEVNTVPQALEAASAGADTIMLDNMNLEDMRQVVELVAGKAMLEASGGINLDNVRAVAMTGVDYISVGAITHSVKGMDFSLEFESCK